MSPGFDLRKLSRRWRSSGKSFGSFATDHQQDAWFGQQGSEQTRRYVVEMPPVLDRDEWQGKYGQNSSLPPPSVQ
jgi:hypothetical protein